MDREEDDVRRLRESGPSRVRISEREKPTSMETLNALTVDVEDYFHVEAFSGSVSRDSWDTFPLRVEANTLRLLDLFDRHQVRATFFILGWVARKRPGLVAEIARRGHEIGCHSFWHRLVYRLTPDEFRADLREATRTIEDAAGVRVRGYRAPTYSVTAKSLWALEILAEEGYAYDSSIFPLRHDVYGLPSFPRHPVELDLDGARGGTMPLPADRRSLIEFPPSTVRALGWNLPGPGGGYLRILPFRYSLWALGRLRREGKMPATVYIHPWEVDPEQPRIRAPLRSRLRHYTGLRRTSARLAALLDRYPFTTMGRVLEAHPPRERLSFLDLQAEIAGRKSAQRVDGSCQAEEHPTIRPT
jgi:polysaccharide deacetylase family protein (PEP-CTERM system associated)